MIRRAVKSVTVEFADGDVETFQGEQMLFTSRINYMRGATKPEHGFTDQEVRWFEPEPLSEGKGRNANGKEGSANS